MLWLGYCGVTLIPHDISYKMTKWILPIRQNPGFYHTPIRNMDNSNNICVMIYFTWITNVLPMNESQYKTLVIKKMLAIIQIGQ